MWKTFESVTRSQEEFSEYKRKHLQIIMVFSHSLTLLKVGNRSNTNWRVGPLMLILWVWYGWIKELIHVQLWHGETLT